MMRTLLLLMLALLTQVEAMAHDPNLASYRVYMENGRWLLRVDLAASSLAFLPENFTNEGEEFKDAFAAYLKDNISFVVNADQKVDLGPGGIRTGAHSVEAIFFLEGLPVNWLTFDAHITCFPTNEHQRHLLRVTSPTSINKAFLDESNDFSVHFEQVHLMAD
jgi:hypothetical protein